MTVVPKLRCIWNHLAIFKKCSCLAPTPMHLDVTGMGYDLGIRIFKSSPGNSKVQQSLGAIEVQYFCLIQAFLQLLGFMDSIFTDSAYIVNTPLSQLMMYF